MLPLAFETFLCYYRVVVELEGHNYSEVIQIGVQRV